MLRNQIKQDAKTVSSCALIFVTYRKVVCVKTSAAVIFSYRVALRLHHFSAEVRGKRSLRGRWFLVNNSIFNSLF